MSVMVLEPGISRLNQTCVLGAWTALSLTEQHGGHQRSSCGCVLAWGFQLEVPWILEALGHCTLADGISQRGLCQHQPPNCSSHQWLPYISIQWLALCLLLGHCPNHRVKKECCQVTSERNKCHTLMACWWVLFLEPNRQPAPTCSCRPAPWGGVLGPRPCCCTAHPMPCGAEQCASSLSLHNGRHKSKMNDVLFQVTTFWCGLLHSKSD